MAKEKIQYQTKFRERMAFGIYGVGLNIFFMIIGSYLQQFYLLEVALKAEVIAVIFIIVKIWDGVNDPLFGIIMDRARLKRGKYLPWLRISTLALPVMTFILFLAPSNASTVVKAIFLLLGYMLYDASCTMAEVPYFAVTTAMTSNPNERTSIISFSKIVSVIPAVVVLFVPSMYPVIGWVATMAIFCVFCMLTMIPACFMIKERSYEQPEIQPTVKDLLQYIGKNKYLLIFFLSAILYGVFNTTGTVTNLFAIFNMGGDEMIVPLLLISTIPSLIAVGIVNVLLRKFEKIHVLIATLIITGALSVLTYFVGYQNLVLFYILTALRGFSTGAHTLIFFLYTPDFSEYGTYVTGTKAEGAAFSVQSFASKVINAISGSVALFILGAIGFLEGNKTQSAEVQEGIWFLFSLFPVIGCVVQGLILAIVFKLRDKDVKIMIQANHGEMSIEEAEQLLGKKYRRKVAIEVGNNEESN